MTGDKRRDMATPAGSSASAPVLRAAVIATARAMNVAGINRGKSGNVSARWRESGFDGFLVRPTGLPYDRTGPDDIVAVSLAGEARGPRVPSSEWRFHRDIYVARPEAQAIVHAHAPFATSLACQHRGIPAFHYMVAVAGGRDIRCAPYATFGTQELSDHVVAALESRQACLLANHGLIAMGVCLLAIAPAAAQGARMEAAGFQDEPVITGLEEPSNFRFAHYRRVFVADKT